MWGLALLLLISTASAETRPRYGGTLRVALRAAPQSLDPAAPNQDPGFAQIAPLLFDTLVQLDSAGRPMPALASSWQQESERRWRFALRGSVRFSDGTALTAATVAQSLHEANPDWTLHLADDAVVIQAEQPLPNLPALLALPRNSIVQRAGGKLLGTGPFRVNDFQPGRRLALTAVEDAWHGRPFLDGVDILLNRAVREQMLDFDLNRADLVEVPPDQLARLGSRRVFAGDPVELLALRFSHSNVRDARVRQAIALTLDRDSISSVLLQRRGEPTAALLPNWITGYSFLFATSPQVARARQLRAEAKLAAPLTLVYDGSDPLARLVAERIAVNANDAGIILKPLPSSQNITVPDVELVRLRLPSTDPAVALAELARTDRLALPLPDAVAPPFSAPASTSLGGPPDSSAAVVNSETISNIYRASVYALQEYWAVPVAYLPAACAVSSRVHNWTRTRDGIWRLEDVWLEAR